MRKVYIGTKPFSQVYLGGKPGTLRVGYEKRPQYLVYELPETTFDGATSIDTGIDLSQYEQYTVCLDAQYSDIATVQNMVDWMTEKSPYPGWTLDMFNRTRFGAKTSITIASATTNRMRYVVRFDGSVYTLFAKNAPTGLDVTNNVAAGTVNHTLYVGAYYNSGSINRYVHSGSKIWSFQVYPTALI